MPKALASLILSILLVFQGCSQQATIAALVATLGGAVSTIVSLSGNPELGEKLRHDTQLATELINGWKPGTSAADAIRALNKVIDDIQSLQVPEKYKPFITLALGTAASIIDILNSRGGGEQAHTKVRIIDPPHSSKEFKKDWDALRDSGPSPDLQQVPEL